MDTKPDPTPTEPEAEHSALADYWDAVEYVVRWANGEEITVIQPPIPSAA